MPVLRARHALLPQGVAADVSIAVEDHRVASVTTDTGGDDPIWAWLTPGFVDVHTHGGGGHLFTDGPRKARVAVECHRRHGTTTTLAGVVTAPVATMVRQVAALAELADAGVVAGVHLEGPFLSAVRCGAHDPAHLLPPDVAVLRRLLDAGRGHVRQVTLAPELPGAAELVRMLVDAGVTAAIGHTDATYAQASAAFDAGARLATHLFNAMRPAGHREPGPALAALDDERVRVELIADGVHLHDAVVRLAFARAPGRVVLVTDAVAAAGGGDGRYRLGAHEVEVRGGVARLSGSDTIAGSTLTMDAAVRRVVAAGISVPEALVAASVTPAAVLEGTAGIEPGFRADLVALDDELRVTQVYRDGEPLL